MKYNPPSGSIDPNAPYVGKNVAAGIQGSRVPRWAVEADQREIVHVIDFAGLDPTNDDLEQLRKAIQKICRDMLTGPGSAELLNSKLLLVEATRPAGAANVPLTSTWSSWALNSVLTNEIPGASLNLVTRYITLPAGRYRASYAGMVNGDGSHQIRLFDRTANVELGHGLCGDSYVLPTTPVNHTTNASQGEAKFVLTTTSLISLDHVGADTPGAVFGDVLGDRPNYDAVLRIEKEQGA